MTGNSKTILVTGGCGFIGLNLIEKLLQYGFYIRIVDNLEVGKRDDLAAVCDFYEGLHPFDQGKEEGDRNPRSR